MPPDSSSDNDRQKKIVELAKKCPMLCDGSLEVDDNAIVSEGSDNGAYVQAWLWISFEGTELDKSKDQK